VSGKPGLGYVGDRGPQVVDVGLDLRLAAVSDRAGTDRLCSTRPAAPATVAIKALEVPPIAASEETLAPFRSFEATQAIFRVGEEVGLAALPVVDHVQA